MALKLWPVLSARRAMRLITQGIGEREDLGAQTAFGAADGLALSPPFEP